MRMFNEPWPLAWLTHHCKDTPALYASMEYCCHCFQQRSLGFVFIISFVTQLLLSGSLFNCFNHQLQLYYRDLLSLLALFHDHSPVLHWNLRFCLITSFLKLLTSSPHLYKLYGLLHSSLWSKICGGYKIN